MAEHKPRFTMQELADMKELADIYEMLAALDSELDEAPRGTGADLEAERVILVDYLMSIGGVPAAINTRLIPWRRNGERYDKWTGEHHGAPVMRDPRDVLHAGADSQDLVVYAMLRRKEQGLLGRQMAFEPLRS